MATLREIKRPEIEATIDEYGELDRQKQLFAPVEARLKVLKEEIEKHLKDAPADKPAILRGALYEIQLSPRRNERTLINPKKAFLALKKALGLDGLLSLVDIPFGAAIDKHIPKSEQKGMVAEERSGWRTLTVTPLAPPNLKLVSPPVA